MYVHFYLVCNASIQMRLHHAFRQKVKEWKDFGLVSRAVMTYHFNNPPDPDYLSICLDVPSVQEPVESSVIVSQERMNLPSLITAYVNDVCKKNQIEPKIFNYRLEIEAAKKKKEEKGELYYNGAPVDEILRFASTGTGIALEVLNRLEQNEKTWNQDLELAEFIESRLRDEFESSYKWIDWAWHFVCNPLLVSEGYLTAILYGRSNPALTAIRNRLKV